MALNWGITLFEFLRRLFTRSATTRTFADRLSGPGTFGVEVVGKPHHVHNVDFIWQATSNQWVRQPSPEGDSWEHETDARLFSDSAHAEEPHGISVEIAGRKVGYLSRADALRIHRRLHQLKYDRIDSLCKATITGRSGWWVVRLDIVENLIDEP